MKNKIKTVNSLSGGKSSAYLAVHYPADYEVFSLVCIDRKEATPKDKAVIDYVNKKLEKFIPEFGEFIATAEDDATLQVMMDLEQYIGREIIWVRGMSYDDVIDKGTQTRLPSWARRYCTEKMKLLPIFLWWFNEIGERCKMNIGFRFDEFDRMERFFNNSDPTNFKIPISCSTRGKKQQKHETFNWRFCSLPLIKNAITKEKVVSYWENNGWIGGDLFQEKRQMYFPPISNCIGCFHKSEEGLAAMAEIHPEKFIWFIEQELKGMGTWLDSKITYQHLFDNRIELSKEVLFEIKHNLQTCDTSGCTD
jgi:hypothetical protein